MLQVYNTLKRTLEKFTPVEEGKVKMYVCGPTVYNHIHIGNTRPIVFFDTVHRYLKYSGYDVTFVQNFTDIDDKIIHKANDEGISFQALSEKYIRCYFEDTASLNLLEEHIIHPKATEYINEMIQFVEVLEKKGFAYNSNGDVYFSVEAHSEYGKLSDQNVSDLKEGVRKELMEGKQSPVDFALWKSAKAGEPYWDSPWGKGRPGWHLECSVMSNKILGETFDIHGGGIDLVFPHHENEIAQSECYSGKAFANYWMHNGFLKIDGEKMSKSLNNFMLLKDVAAEYSGSVIRLFFLQSHYRKPIDFSRQEMDMTKASLERLRNSYDRLIKAEEKATNQGDNAEVSVLLAQAKERFKQGMDTDFNTSLALAALYDLVRGINACLDQKALSKTCLSEIIHFLEACLEGVFGINLIDTEQGNESSDDYIDFLVALRYKAKQERNFTLADEIRAFLSEKNIEIRDSKEESTWKKI